MIDDPELRISIDKQIRKLIRHQEKRMVKEFNNKVNDLIIEIHHLKCEIDRSKKAVETLTNKLINIALDENKRIKIIKAIVNEYGDINK